MIRGIKEHLFAVLRDVVFAAKEYLGAGRDPARESSRVPMMCQSAGSLVVW